MLVAFNSNWRKTYVFLCFAAAFLLLILGPSFYRILISQQPGHNLGIVGLNLDFGEIYPIISSVRAGSPGEKAGIQREDILLAIDGKNTAMMCERQVLWSLRGPVTEPVKLTVLTHDDKLLIKTIHRIWPGDLPGGGDDFLYAKRSWDADLPLKEPFLQTELTETPWCMANSTRTEIYFVNSGLPSIPLSIGHRPDPLIAVCRFGTKYTPPPRVLKAYLSMNEPDVRKFARRFGIESPPASVVLDSLDERNEGMVHIKSASVSKQLKRAIPAIGYY